MARYGNWEIAAAAIPGFTPGTFATASPISRIADTRSWVGAGSRIYRLVQLAPDLVEGLAEGRLDVGLTPLLRGKFMPCWQAQRDALDANGR
ncbi:MAG: hypothetical protein LBV45_07090 [Xanthomonadaceae bacterium]|nr:hypothetical protein [Xanthomonadaceae bacterium]